MRLASRLFCWLLLVLPACNRDFDPVEADVGAAGRAGLGGAAPSSDDCVEASDGTSTYRACVSLESYDEASADCAAWGGTLVILDSADEEANVTELSYTHGAANYWIGGSDTAEESVWRWSDGRVFWDHENIPAGVYVHWAPGEPTNGSGSTAENCAYQYRRVGWNDVDCAVERPFVCEK